MKRRTVLLAAGGGAALTAGLAGRWWSERPDSGVAAADLFALRLPTPGGGELDLGKLRGRPLIVNFWATWCAPCIRELPALNRFARDHAPRGWQVLGIAIDNREPVLEFLRKLPVEFPVVLAGLQGIALTERLGNRASGLPFTVLFSADGRIQERKAGETNYEELTRWAARHGMAAP